MAAHDDDTRHAGEPLEARMPAAMLGFIDAAIVAGDMASRHAMIGRDDMRNLGLRFPNRRLLRLQPLQESGRVLRRRLQRGATVGVLQFRPARAVQTRHANVSPVDPFPL